MATIKPFCAYRPVRDKVHLVASRSYVSYSRGDLKSKLDENPFTFLHVIHPEHTLKIGTKPNTNARYRLVKQRFDQFVEEGIFQHDEKKSFYVYRQIKNGHAYIGIIGCASIDDYFNNVIKKHEATITVREKMFKNYLDQVKVNAEPVCFTYPNEANIDKIIAETIEQRAEYDFTTTNTVRHSFWVIDDEKTVETIEKSFSKMPAIYIADGHHRSASSALLGKENREKEKGKKLGTDHFMGIFIAESNLKIYEFNRLINDIGRHDKESFISEISQQFHIIPKGETPYKAQKIHEISMYFEGQWYCLIPSKDIYDEKNPVSALDVKILSDNILEPILGIKDLKTDPRVTFMAGTFGLEKLQQLVDSKKAKVAFAHFPVSIEQLKAVADANQIMPPKSTWIEPKLRSGLTVYSMQNCEI